MAEIAPFDTFLTDILSDVRAESKKRKEGMYTYIMYDPTGISYKIGRSKNPIYREKTLQSLAPKIVTLGILNRDIEKELHQRFKASRIRGEWFLLLSDEVYAILDEYEFEILPFEKRN